jgi:hypothetical protein
MVDTHTPLGVVAFVERIVRESNLRSARARDALRRELLDHFEDAAAMGASVDAVERFGSPVDIAAGFRRAYRRGRRALYALKVLTSAAAATLLALVLQLPLHLQLAPVTIAVAPLYRLAAQISIAVVLIAVAAWELEIEWLCARLERDPARLVGCGLVMFIVLLASHAYLGMDVTPTHSLVGSAAMITVWTSSLAILSRADRVFVRLLGDAV